MDNQKLENILNLALQTSREQREKSAQLGVGHQPLENTWELIVKYHGDLNSLSGELIKVEELIAGYAIVTLPENLVDAFAELENVEYIEKPKRLYFATERGKEASCIPPVTMEPPFLTGRGVLIGVIDSGIDVNLPEFWDDSGDTRIAYLWDQTLDADAVNANLTKLQSDSQTQAGRAALGEVSAPEGFFTGVEFSGERINAARRENILQRAVPGFDTSGHGTTVAAIAAAGGRLDGGRYKGVAPESELIVVKLGNPDPLSFPRTTQLMRALTYMVKKAVRLGKPIAINLSFGNTYGSHDGTSLLERFMDNVAEIGRCVICVGSGNEGAAAGHVSGSFLQDGNVQLQVVRTQLNVGEYQQSLGVQLWKEYVDRFRVRLRSPSGEELEIDTLRPGKQSFVLEQTEILLYLGEPAPYSVNQEIYFDMIPMGRYVNQGIWTFEIEAVETLSGNFDFYLPGSTVLNADTRFFTPNPVKTLTIPSTSAKVITVGAYDAVFESYADFSGRGYPLQSILDERTSQGSIKPDIAAPGVNILSVTSDGRPVQVTGTSFATPFVTGSAALMMEWGIVRGNDPFLYGEKIKAYFRRGAEKLRGETVYPNEKVGYGALCLKNSLPI